MKQKWSKQQKSIFNWFEDCSGSNLVVRARAGCLAADTLLNINRAGKGSSMAIEKVAAQMNGKPPTVTRSDNGAVQHIRPWDLSISTKAGRAVNGVVCSGVIRDSWCSGTKETYTLTTETGRAVRATAEHPFMLVDGSWALLADLRRGYKVAVDTGQGKATHQPKRQYRQVDTSFHPHQVPNGTGRYKVAFHRLVVEAKMNRLRFDEYIEILRLNPKAALELEYLHSNQHVHHKDGDHRNNKLRNLTVVEGQVEHSRHHDYASNVLHQIGGEEIVSIEKFGEETTFDIEMIDAPHNFLANGFVVHNTGKTTTILEGIDRAPDNDILLAAFNRRIADELAQRCTNPNARVKTLHALGYAFIRRTWSELGPIEVDSRRTLGLLYGHAKANHMPYIGKLPARWIAGLATLMKELHPFDAEDEGLVEFVGMSFGILPDLNKIGWGLHRVMPLVQHLVRASKEYTGKVDYADMLYLPLVLEMTEPLFDLVVVDEAQDMNHAQLDLALQCCTAEGRMCVVGDDRQAIYGFRGADSGAIDRMKEQLEAEESPLSTTYRCPKQVVKEANRLVPDLKASKKEEGRVTTIKSDAEFMKLADKGDFVLSRTNAPLAHTCLLFLRDGKPARIIGRDVGESLIRHIDKQANSGFDDPISMFIQDLQAYEVMVVRSLTEADRDEAVGPFIDLMQTIKVLCESGCMTVGDLRTRIKSLFVDVPPEDMIILSTVHKAKGLEADRVFILKNTLYNFDVTLEEQNIEYVAITRAKKELVWVGTEYGNAKRNGKEDIQ